MDKLTLLFQDIAKLWAKSGSQYLGGALSTIELAVAATAIGLLIGLFCGILQTIPSSKDDNIVKRIVLRIVKAVVRIYVEVFRGTPMILQAVFIYFAIPYFSNNAIRLNVIPAAYLVVSINTGAYMAETVRGGILSIDKTMLYVILPQTIRNIIPQIGNNLIINIKDTSVMFIIGFTELFAVHKGVVGATYLYFPSAVVEMAMYLAMTVISSILLRLWERKMAGPANFDVATTDSLAHTSGMVRFTPKKSGREGK